MLDVGEITRVLGGKPIALPARTTHNPITMARMTRLFGVTMAEQDVSQLVSVDHEVAELMREAS
jgi:hypothetical protein